MKKANSSLQPFTLLPQSTRSSNYLIVPSEYELQRIDNFLFNHFKSLPKSRIYRMIRNGELRVNSRRVQPTYKLKAADKIRLPPLRQEENSQTLNLQPSPSLIELLLKNILFEDHRIMVLNKPIGIASHGGSGINFGVIETLRIARPDLKNLELIHRLDRDTSGCLMLAKKRSALRWINALIAQGKTNKRYLLLVQGEWPSQKLVTTLPLRKYVTKSGERMVVVDEAGQTATTIFRRLRSSSEVSLLEAELKTGRTHQIRVHTSHSGHPIAGDQKYGDKTFNASLKQQGLKRLFLHAHSLEFTWEDGETFSVKAPLDEELTQLIDRLFH